MGSGGQWIGLQSTKGSRGRPNRVTGGQRVGPQVPRVSRGRPIEQGVMGMPTGSQGVLGGQVGRLGDLMGGAIGLI